MAAERAGATWCGGSDVERRKISCPGRGEVAKLSGCRFLGWGATAVGMSGRRETCGGGGVERLPAVDFVSGHRQRVGFVWASRPVAPR